MPFIELFIGQPFRHPLAELNRDRRKRSLGDSLTRTILHWTIDCLDPTRMLKGGRWTSMSDMTGTNFRREVADPPLRKRPRSLHDFIHRHRSWCPLDGEANALNSLAAVTPDLDRQMARQGAVGERMSNLSKERVVGIGLHRGRAMRARPTLAASTVWAQGRPQRHSNQPSEELA
jgi:hypothetical protein